MTAATLLRELDQRMTPGPWEVSRGSSFNAAEYRAPDPHNGLMLIRVAARDGDIEDLAAIRNALPALADALEALQRISGLRLNTRLPVDEAIGQARIEMQRTARAALAVVAAQLQGDTKQ